jgi:hypothetical protein
MDFVAFRTDLSVFMIFFQCNHGSDRDSECPLPYRRRAHPLRKRIAICWGDVAPYLLLKAELLCYCAIPWINR